MADEQIGGAPSIPLEAPPAPAGKTVAYENFDAVVRAKTSLEARVKELQSQLEGTTARAAEAESWKAKAAEAEGRFASYTEFSGVLGATDPEIISAFDQRYRALPEDGRPQRAAWVETLRAQPEAAPALLRPWLSPAAPTSPGARPPAPKVPGTPATPPNPPAQVSDAEIARVREEAVRTGDWSAWKKLRSVVGVVR